MAEDASVIIHVREDAPEHLALAAGLGHVSIVNNLAGRMSGVLGVRAHGDIHRKFLVDVAENASPVNPVIGKDAIEHILTAAKQRLQGASAVIRGILDGKEREEDHQLDHLGTGELAVAPLLEGHLPFCDVYGAENVHYPLYAESAATFCEKIALLRNYLPIFAHARCILLFAYSNILKINETTKYFRIFDLAFFRLIFTCET